MKQIMILGGSIMQLPAVQTAKRKGWRVILADRNQDVPARPWADAFEEVDLKDKETMLSRASCYRQKDSLDGIFTAGTDFSATVAYVAEKLGLPGISYDAALKASRKHLMRDAFAAKGVPSPGFCSVGPSDDWDAACGTLTYPLVVKPVDNMGARGVRRVDNPGEMREAVRTAVSFSQTERVIIEEYIQGPEYSLDALVEKGRVVITGFADRHIFFPPYFVETGHTIPAELPEEAAGSIIAVFLQGIKALGIDNGAAKGDIKLSPGGPVVGEIAARLSGGYMSGWSFPLASDINLTEGALNIAVGLPSGIEEAECRRTCAERAFISIPGKVSALEGWEEARAIPGVKEAFLRIKKGDALTFPVNNVQKCGNFLAVHHRRLEAVRAAEEAAARVLIRLEPLERITDLFLTGNGEDWIPPAYLLSQPENRRIVKEMPLFKWDSAAAELAGPPAILALPRQEEGRGWTRETFGRSLDRLLDISGARLFPYRKRGEKCDNLLLGGLFWRFFLRGGIQGGLYLLDSIRALGEKGEIMEYLRSLGELEEQD